MAQPSTLRLVKCQKKCAFGHQMWPAQGDWHHNRVKKDQNLSGEEVGVWHFIVKGIQPPDFFVEWGGGIRGILENFDAAKTPMLRCSKTREASAANRPSA